MMQTFEALLAEHPFFAGLEPPYLQVIAGFASTIHYESEKYIFHEGEQATHFYIILEGKVALETFAAERGVITIETIEAGEVLGWSWLFPPYRWHFAARVVEPTMAIVLDGAALRAKGEEDHQLGYELMKRVAQIMMQRLQATRLQLLDMYSTRA
jgi:CRP/FNR family cyclic AMP-dependent transcriptional regulator